MLSLPVIQYFHIAKYRCSCLIAGSIIIVVNLLDFKTVEEALHDRIIPTQSFDFSARAMATFMGGKNDLEQRRGVVSGTTNLIIFITRIKHSLIEVLIDQKAKRVRKDAEGYLFGKDDGDKFTLVKIIVFIASRIGIH